MYLVRASGGERRVGWAESAKGYEPRRGRRRQQGVEAPVSVFAVHMMPVRREAVGWARSTRKGSARGESRAWGGGDSRAWECLCRYVQYI